VEQLVRDSGRCSDEGRETDRRVLVYSALLSEVTINAKTSLFSCRNPARGVSSGFLRDSGLFNRNGADWRDNCANDGQLAIEPPREKSVAGQTERSLETTPRLSTTSGLRVLALQSVAPNNATQASNLLTANNVTSIIVPISTAKNDSNAARRLTTDSRFRPGYRSGGRFPFW